MERWLILATLTLARSSMGLQFQSVAAVGPDLIGRYGFSYAGLGLLIGLYLLPGVALALPGGWLAQRFGDKRLVVIGLALMTAGGAVLGLSEHTGVMVCGRVVSGAGAVLLNVLVTKMTADWFAGRDTVTAMGVLITSWPAGIALAMVLLPPLALVAGTAAALLAGSALAALSLVLVALIYRPPRGATAAAAPAAAPGMSRRELTLAVLAGAVWTFYNAGLILVLAFAPDLLSAGGADPVRAAAAVSLVSWLIIPSLAAGGWIAARVGRPDALLVGCLVAAGAVILVVPTTGAMLLPFVLIGLLFGPPGPVIMTLPVAAVRAANRAPGMGIYFTCYYAGMALAPPFAGAVRDATGEAAAPLWVAVGCLVIACAALVAFRALQARAPLPAAA